MQAELMAAIARDLGIDHMVELDEARLLVARDWLLEHWQPPPQPALYYSAFVGYNMPGEMENADALLMRHLPHWRISADKRPTDLRHAMHTANPEDYPAFTPCLVAALQQFGINIYAQDDPVPDWADRKLCNWET